MARFRTTGKYAGKGQKDLEARVASLMARGEPEPSRNLAHPHLYCRAEVQAAEDKLRLLWNAEIQKHIVLPA